MAARPVASETMGSQSRNISRIGEPPIQYADVKSRGLLPRVLLLRFVTFGISVGAVDVGTLSGVFFENLEFGLARQLFSIINGFFSILFYFIFSVTFLPSSVRPSERGRVVGVGGDRVDRNFWLYDPSRRCD